jgi:hypothetical protein
LKGINFVEMTTIMLKGAGLADSQPFELQIALETTINVDTRTARRVVTGWLVDEVGNLLIGGQPQFVIHHKAVWRVPVLATSSISGIIGEVGVVDVDAGTGKVEVSKKLRKQILDNVKQLVSSISTATR